MAFCLFGVVISVQANNAKDISSSPILGSSYTITTNNGNSEVVYKRATHRFVDDISSTANISSIQYQQNLFGNGLHLNLSHSESEYHTAIGYSLGGLTFSAIQGSSESFVRHAENFQHINRFSLHGGIDSGFDFYGTAIHSKLNDHLSGQFGSAELVSHHDGLETRGTQYIELSSSSTYQGFSGLYGRFSTYQRGDDQIGRGIEAGFSYNNTELIIHSMKVDGNKHLLGLRSLKTLNDQTQLSFEFSKAHDPNHFNETRYQALVSIHHVLEKPRRYQYSLSQGMNNSSNRNRILRPVLIGAGVIAGIALSSSGSETVDNSSRSQSETDAAFQILNEINPKSIRENREYGGWVYRNQDQTYGTSSPVAGEAASVTLPNPSSSTPSGSRLTASYHTHAAFDPRYDNENFSDQDIRSDNALGIGGYLATPGGTFQYHFGGNIELLGQVATE